MTTPPKGKVIVVEGIDGSGKSTLASALATVLDGMVLREPCGAPHYFGSWVRARLVEGDPIAKDWTPAVWATIMLAAMVQQDVVARDLVAQGLAVIFDRRHPSTWVYQGGLDVVGPPAEDPAGGLVMTVAGSLVPVDLYVYLRCPVDVAMTRLQSRAPDGEPASVFERRATLERAAARYETYFDPLFQRYGLDRTTLRPSKVLTLDATEPTDALMRDVVRTLEIL